MLVIFTSYTPGAGKSYMMIEKAMEEKAKGKKVLVGFLHEGHRDIKDILIKNGIEEKDIPQKGLSLAQIKAENPDIVILDEMGMKVKNRGFVYNIIDKMFDYGITVYTSVNVKRFDSANPRFKDVTGISIKNTVPHKYLEKADKIYFIDRDSELMIKDFEAGKLFGDKYMNSKIMQKNFKKETLDSYRQVSIKYLEKYKDKVEIVERSNEQ